VSIEGAEVMLTNSECCKIPKTNTTFWVNKIRRNKERDAEEQRLLASMGWHCIVVWECELKPAVREQTLKSLAFTLNRIWMDDHGVRNAYPHLEAEDIGEQAAEEISFVNKEKKE